MLNHGRTLLLNRGPTVEALGERLVPRSFTALDLPSYLRQLRGVLFGRNPDRAMFNYRLAQLMAVLHSTEYEQYLFDLDPRVTYLRRDDLTLARPETYHPLADRVGTGDDTTVTTASVYFVPGDAISLYVPWLNYEQGSEVEIFIQGNPTPPDATGRMFYKLRLDLVAGSQVTVTQQTPTRRVQTTSLNYTQGISNPVALGDAGYDFRLTTNATGESWRIWVYNEPQWGPGQLEQALNAAGDPTLQQLFGSNPTEPYRTFRNLWFQHEEMPYRLSGLLLAMIYRTDEVLNAQST
jgi:hypothetical protein